MAKVPKYKCVLVSQIGNSDQRLKWTFYQIILEKIQFLAFLIRN